VTATATGPLQGGVGTVIALVRVTAIVLGVALGTGGTAGVLTLFVVRGITGHRLYDSTGDSFKTGAALGLGVIALYVVTVAVLELTTTGRLEFLVAPVVVVVAGITYVARPLSDDPEHAVGRYTLAAVTVLVFAVAYLLALVFAYPLVSNAVESLVSMA